MDPAYHNPGYGQRYPPFSPLPPPPASPHPQTYPENPNFYGGTNRNPHSYLHHQPPPPPPPPPINQTPPYYSSSLPPPQHHPPYNPRQYTYASKQIPQPSYSSSSSHIQSQVGSQYPWVEHQETRPGSREPGASTGYNYQFDYSRLSIDRSGNSFRQSLENSSRFRDEFSGRGFAREEVGIGRIEDNHHSRGQTLLDSDRYSRVLGVGNMCLESNSGYRDARYGSELDRQVIRNRAGDVVSEHRRWNMESEPSNGVGARFVQKRDDCYPSEIKRYMNEESRGGSNQLYRTPRKKVQKKSVLLRLQNPRPNQRSRESDRSRFSCHYDERKSGSFRNRDQLGHSDCGLAVKQREKTPMELDVSFKSNALVAKTIKSSTSVGAGSGSGLSLTPRARKMRRVLPTTGKDNKVSQNEGTGNVEGNTHVVDKKSGSGTGLKQSEREVTASAVENKCHSLSNLSSIVPQGKVREEKSLEVTVPEGEVMAIDKDIKTSLNEVPTKVESSVHVAAKALSIEKPLKQSTEVVGPNVSDGKINAEKCDEDTLSDTRGTSSAAGIFPLPKVSKKKKFVMKIVKKLAKPPSKSLASLSTEKLSGKLEAGNSCYVTSMASETVKASKFLEKEVPFAGISSVPSAGQDFPNDVSENDKKNVSSKVLGMKDIDIGTEHGKICVGQIKRKRKSSGYSLGSSGKGKVEIEETSINTKKLSTNEEVCDQSITQSVPWSTACVEGGSKKIYQNGDSLLPENGALGDCSKGLLFPGENTKSGTISEENIISKDLANSNHHSELNTATSFDLSDRNIVSQTGKPESSGNQEIEATPSVMSGGVKGSTKSGSFRHCSEILPLRSSEQMKDSPGPLFSDCCNYGKETISASSTALEQAEETNLKSGSDAASHACEKEATSFPGARKGSLDVKPIQESEEYMLEVCKDGEPRSCELELPEAISADTLVASVDIGSSACGIDTALKNSCHDEDAVTDTMIVGSNACTDGVSVLHSSGITACFSESKVSVGNNFSNGPSRTLLERETRQKPSVYDRFSSLSTPAIDNSDITTDIGNSTVEMVSGSGVEFVAASECRPQEEEIKLPHTEPGWPPGLPPFSERVKTLLENCSGHGSFDAVGSVRDSYMDGGLVNDQLRINSCLVSSSIVEDEKIGNIQASSNPEDDDLMDMEISRGRNKNINASEEKLLHMGWAAKCITTGIDSGPISCPSFNPSGLVTEQIRNETPVAASVHYHEEIMGAESNKEDKKALEASQVEIITFHEGVQSGNSLETHTSYSGQPSPHKDFESEEPPASNFIPLAAYQDGVPTGKSSNDLLGTLPDAPSDSGSSENSPGNSGFHILNCEVPCSQISDGKFCGNHTIQDDNYDGVGGSSDIGPSSSPTNSSGQLVHAKDHLVAVLSSDSKNKTATLNSMAQETWGRKNHFNYAVYKSYSKRNVNPPTRITKPHTWHRSSNASTPPLSWTTPFASTVLTQTQLPKSVSDVQSSYIRKGNSLLRKPAPGRVYHGIRPCARQLSVSSVDEAKSIKSGQRVGGDASNSEKAGGMHTPFGRPPTPPLSSGIKGSDLVTIPSGECTLSPGAGPLANNCPEITANCLKHGESDVPKSCDDGLKVSETSVNQTGYDSESRKEDNAAILASSNPTDQIYVKRKSNQLVAATNIYDGSKIRISSSNSYYKRRKNQLVRASDGHVKQPFSTRDDALNAEVQAATKLISKREFSGPFSDKAVTKSFGCSKLSLVWRLNGAPLTKTGRGTLQRQKILPQLFPWKRATYWRSIMNSVSVSSNSSLSTISRKLLLLRKRHTVYTRSINGYSLRKSKVLSIGGSHLKWSKSIERDSKKANEEATLAVAAAVKEKREHLPGSGISGTKKRNNFARQRIFRIGSVRYKMDSSGRTLQRISDDESSRTGPPISRNDAKMSFVPRRLVIGNEEYVRVANGNQLIRDPKKRTRALASEKVRWSLHTARLRLAKKRKFCQFFTRFGKCNKVDGKCPYIHDPSKIAVCTKFLNGLCTNSNCNLTHKVIPERMPDCSYFQHGLCNNEACPYRHVHVNPNASTCEGFLRGYCADGNECPKKHTYTCPDFEATGSCPQGSKCKLHHPKKQSKGKKRKRTCKPSQKNARGRYFGCLHNNIPEPESAVLDWHTNHDEVFKGQAADYISLDASEEEIGDDNNLPTEPTLFGESDASYMQFDDIEELIKPVRIMDKNLVM